MGYNINVEEATTIVVAYIILVVVSILLNVSIILAKN